MTTQWLRGDHTHGEKCASTVQVLRSLVSELHASTCQLVRINGLETETLDRNRCFGSHLGMRSKSKYPLVASRSKCQHTAFLVSLYGVALPSILTALLCCFLCCSPRHACPQMDGLQQASPEPRSPLGRHISMLHTSSTRLEPGAVRSLSAGTFPPFFSEVEGSASGSGPIV